MLRSVETQPSDSKICSLQTNRSSFLFFVVFNVLPRDAGRRSSSSSDPVIVVSTIVILFQCQTLSCRSRLRTGLPAEAKRVFFPFLLSPSFGARPPASSLLAPGWGWGWGWCRGRFSFISKFLPIRAPDVLFGVSSLLSRGVRIERQNRRTAQTSSSDHGSSVRFVVSLLAASSQVTTTTRESASRRFAECRT